MDNKKTIMTISILSVMVLLAGVGLYLVTRRKDNENNSNNPYQSKPRLIIKSNSTTEGLDFANIGKGLSYIFNPLAK